MIKFLFFCFFLVLNLNAGYEEGKMVFENKCSSCHGAFVEVNLLKENFFEKQNKLLNLKAPTVNMLAYAIMDSPKKIGDVNDKDIQEIEIQKYLKSYLENPDRFNSICDDHILKFYDIKKSMKNLLSDEDYVNLTTFFMEYKSNLKDVKKETTKNIQSSSSDNIILDKAKKENKKIIVYATSKSCFYCKKMERDVLNLDEIKKQIDKNYIFIKNDMDESNLPFSLEKVYKKITPTFFILSKEGVYETQYPGAWVKSDFLQILEENIKNDK